MPLRSFTCLGERFAKFRTGQNVAIHKDPFDRILVVQATVEGIMLVTSDSLVARYPGPIQLV